MSVITSVPEPNIWDLICKDFEKKKPPFQDEDTLSVATDRQDYDASLFHPAVYGQNVLNARVDADFDPVEEFDPSISHPAIVGYAFMQKPPKPPSPPPTPPPDKKTCPPREYLEYYIFPYLLPALEAMLKQAKVERCFERKRTKFNACDFITEYLYRHNPNHTGREDTILWDIPFVQDWLRDHPRPPIPKSLLWTEADASLKIQSFWRGFQTRSKPEVEELRKWQLEWREINADINERVDSFWAERMPEEEDTENGKDKDTSHVTENEPTEDEQQKSKGESDDECIDNEGVYMGSETEEAKKERNKSLPTDSGSPSFVKPARGQKSCVF